MKLHSEDFYNIMYDQGRGVGYCKHSPGDGEMWHIMCLRDFPGLAGVTPCYTTIYIGSEADYKIQHLEVLSSVY